MIFFERYRISYTHSIASLYHCSSYRFLVNTQQTLANGFIAICLVSLCNQISSKKNVHGSLLSPMDSSASFDQSWP